MPAGIQRHQAHAGSAAQPRGTPAFNLRFSLRARTGYLAPPDQYCPFICAPTPARGEAIIWRASLSGRCGSGGRFYGSRPVLWRRTAKCLIRRHKTVVLSVLRFQPSRVTCACAVCRGARVRTRGQNHRTLEPSWIVVSVEGFSGSISVLGRFYASAALDVATAPSSGLVGSSNKIGVLNPTWAGTVAIAPSRGFTEGVRGESFGVGVRDRGRLRLVGIERQEWRISAVSEGQAEVVWNGSFGMVGEKRGGSTRCGAGSLAIQASRRRRPGGDRPAEGGGPPSAARQIPSTLARDASGFWIDPHALARKGAKISKDRRVGAGVGLSPAPKRVGDMDRSAGLAIRAEHGKLRVGAANVNA